MCLSSAVFSISGSAPVANVAAAGGDVNIGYIDFEIIKWNPLDIDMVEDWVGCFLIFSPLFQYDDTWGGPYPDLGLSYTQEVNGDGTMSTTIVLSQNAYFRNAANPTDTSHPVTSVDVEFTYRTIIENPGGTWDEYLKNISAMNIIDDYTIEIVTDYPKATIIDDLSSIPIIPEYQWSTVQKNQILKSVDPDWLVGSGPFIFDSLDGAGGWYKFAAAPNYHGATDWGRDVDFDNLIFQSWQSIEGLVLAQNTGQLDCIYIGSDPGPFEELGGPDATVPIMKYAVSEPGICDVAINAIPLELRTPSYATGNELLLDPAVRKAIMMTLDKNYLVNVTLMGYGVKADSVLHPTFWKKDISPELEINFTAAKQLLIDSGYSADSDGDGYLEATDASLAVQMGWVAEGAEISGIRLRVPDTNPSYADVGQAWAGWAGQAGIGLAFEIASETIMINQDWYQADYDIWVWGWGWGAEPLSSLSVWLSSEITVGGDNCQMPMGEWYTYDPDTGVVYSSFDENYSLAQRTVNVDDRKVIIDNLQQMIYDSYTENPPFYDLGLYGMTDQRFTGWGEWDTHVGRALTSSLPWVWFDLEPVTNQRPIFDSPLNSMYEVLVNIPTDFNVVVHDVEGDEIILNWSYGDGDVETTVLSTGTDVPTQVTVSHTYDTLASDLYLNVTLDDGYSIELAQSSSIVKVVDKPDTSPTIKSVSPNVPSPVYVGDVVTWTGVANDSESGGATGFGLLFTWEWGDGTFTTTSYQPTVNDTDVTDVQTHSWSTSGTKYVKLWVYDGYDVPTNELHNVSSDATVYEVVVNQPPSTPVVSPIAGPPDVALECIGSSSDVDPIDDSLRFTWDWGDGTMTVFNYDNTVPGDYIVSTTIHTWAAENTYTVTLYVDDLTGVSGHNVSSSVDALISSANTAPSALMLALTPMPLLNDTALTCNASAIDYDGDDLLFYVDFGDGSDAVATSTGDPGDRQYVEIEHTYDYPGTYEVLLHVNDSTGPADHNVSAVYEFTVSQILNYPPVLSLQSAYSALYNRTFTVQPISVTDAEGDTVTVWYDWGDGSEMTKGDGADNYSAQHVYSAVETFYMSVSADDGQGNNQTKTAPVTVLEANYRPSVGIGKSPLKAKYLVDESIQFNVSVTDIEGDTVTVEIDFGDGSDTETVVVDLEAGVTEVVYFNHSYSTASANAYDVMAYANDSMDHSDMTRLSASTAVLVEHEGGLSTLAIAGMVAIVAIVVLLVAYMLLKRKKGKSEDGGGMEGMAQAPPPPQV